MHGDGRPIQTSAPEGAPAIGRPPHFRDLVATERPLVLPGAHDALSALLIRQAGFKAYFIGGFPVAGARHGLPDIGLLGQGEFQAAYRDITAASDLPVLVDADGLTMLATEPDLVRRRGAATVLTPHDREFARFGMEVGEDRLGAARCLAADLGCVVLLKGNATVVADADGTAFVNATGTSWLATAGTGDVLSGIIGALLAHRVRPLHAAAAGAWVHGRAARLGPSVGFIASDLPALIPQVLAAL